MAIKRVVLTGGAGFIGRCVANALCKQGVTVVIPVRRLHRAGHVALLPSAEVVTADIHDPARLRELFAAADAVINLVGVLYSRDGQPYGPAFEQAHVALPHKIIEACRASGVSRLIHFSALGADAKASSGYLRSKAAGENRIRQAGESLGWTILRPAAVFGAEDHFIRVLGMMVRLLPLLPLAAAEAKLQPVHVGDVVKVVLRLLSEPKSIGQCYELAGLSVYSLQQIVALIAKVEDRNCRVWALPDSLARLQAAVMEWAPNPLLSRDHLRTLLADNVASGVPLPFGMTPSSLESLLPSCIDGSAVRGRYFLQRRRARRRAV